MVPGGAWDNDYAPTLTTSAFEFNNYVLEVLDDDDTQTGAERGGETPASPSRRQRGEVLRREDPVH